MLLIADAVAVGNLVSTIVLALLTFAYVRLTHRLVRAQTDPCVVVYVQHDQSRPTILLVVIENVGGSMARDVRFELSEPFFKAFGVQPEAVSAPEILTEGPFVSGIPALPPRGTRILIWGQYFGLKQALSGRQLKIVCNFNRVGSGEIDLEPLEPVESVLELESFAYHDAVDPDGARQCAKHVKELVSVLKDRFPS